MDDAARNDEIEKYNRAGISVMKVIDEATAAAFVADLHETEHE